MSGDIPPSPEKKIAALHSSGTLLGARQALRELDEAWKELGDPFPSFEQGVRRAYELERKDYIKAQASLEAPFTNVGMIAGGLAGVAACRPLWEFAENLLGRDYLDWARSGWGALGALALLALPLVGAYLGFELGRFLAKPNSDVAVPDAVERELREVSQRLQKWRRQVSRVHLLSLREEMPTSADAVTAGQAADDPKSRPFFDRVKDIFG